MYTIIYEGMDSAMFEDGKTNPTTYTVETETFTLNNPTRKGYKFAGWTGTNLANPAEAVAIAKGTTGDITLTANWTIVTYGITYSLGDGALKAGETNPTEHTVETETFTLQNPTLTGYTFAGWTGTNLDRVSKEVTIAKGTTGALIYTANWAIEERGVTLTGGTGISGFEYRVNGGGLKTFDQQATILVLYGSTLEIKAIAAPGYRFTKWGDGETKNPRTVKANESVTLEASADAVEYAIAYVTPTYKIGENVVSGISFNNTYKATGSLTLTASKTVNGKEPTEKQKYNFELRSGDYSKTKQNIGGTVTFDALNYTQDDAGNTYVYTVKETTQSAGGLTADPTVYTVEVKVEDNYNGTLSVTPTYYIGEGEAKKRVEADENGGSPVKFENRLVGSVVFSKTVEGGTPEEGETFAFTCFFEDENGQPLTEQFAYCDERGNQLGVVGHEGTLVLKASESVVIEGLPVGTICTIAEENVSPRYTTTVNKEETSEIRLTVETLEMPAAFVNKMVTTGFKVTKVWQDGNEGAISLTLYANGQKMEPQPACNRSGDTYTYTGLPMYDAKGNPIQYAAKERPVSGYMTIYKNVAPYESESSFIYDGGTIINRAVTQIAVRMVWKGMDEGEKRPDITLTLYCNGKAVNRKPKLDANGWYHFYNLPISSEPYYVVETPVSGFMTLYQNVGGYANAEDRAYDGGTITNSKLPKTGDGSHIERYMALLVISLVALLGYGIKKKRDQ